MPISELSPYKGSKFCLKARVVTKSDIRRFSNARGDGQLFKVDLADVSGEIAGTFFGRAVDMFYGMLQQGRVYSFSRGTLKVGNPRFDRGKYVITFEEYSAIEPLEDDGTIPGVRYDFRPLVDIESLEVNTLVDVRAVVYSSQEAYTFTSKKSNREMTKREVGLWDDSGPSGASYVDMTFWGEMALSSSLEVGSVIFAKSARISEYNGVKGLNSPAVYELDLPDPEGRALRARFEEHRKANPLPVRARGNAGVRKSLAECREEDLHLGLPPPPGQPFDPTGPRSVHTHLVLATVTHLPLDRMPCYPSCPELVDGFRATGAQAEKRACSKKVSQEGVDTWACAAGHACQRPVYRYICRVGVADHSGSLEVQLYDDVAKRLFACEAEEYARLWDAREEDRESARRVEEIGGRLLWRRVCLRLTAKKEVWQEEERVRYGVNEGSALDLAKEARRMLAEVLASAAPGAAAAAVPGAAAGAPAHAS
nr:replication protein A 70 kDa DNA-binding subunit [Lingulodinium polyedra]QDO16251.1 replication protein A 70 kDa DNA-binding subunit [Lingulodinium polyedra]